MDRPRPRFLQPLDGRDSRVPGREHRIEHDRIALLHAARELEIIFDGDERAGIAVEADVANARAGNDVQEYVEQPGAGTNTSFFPSISFERIVSSGVSISTSCIGMSRVTSYAINRPISLSSRRKFVVLVSLRRISVSLCWISGGSSTLTSADIDSPRAHVSQNHTTPLRTPRRAAR